MLKNIKILIYSMVSLAGVVLILFLFGVLFDIQNYKLYSNIVSSLLVLFIINLMFFILLYYLREDKKRINNTIKYLLYIISFILFVNLLFILFQIWFNFISPEYFVKLVISLVIVIFIFVIILIASYFIKEENELKKDKYIC